jgi:hypothetical protein
VVLVRMWQLSRSRFSTTAVSRPKMAGRVLLPTAAACLGMASLVAGFLPSAPRGKNAHRDPCSPPPRRRILHRYFHPMALLPACLPLILLSRMLGVHTAAAPSYLPPLSQP